jgi:uncharacterized membrane protein HdeD (DUF308 family)
MSAPAPWKLAAIGGVGTAAGLALLSVDWTVTTLAAFTGLALIARGASYLVASPSFLGFAGAFTVLQVGGDVGVGITILAWPQPTLLTVAALVGSWTIIRAIAGATIAVTTRGGQPGWTLSVLIATITGIVGVILIASHGSVSDAAVFIGLIMLFEAARDITGAWFRHRHERRRRALTDTPATAAGP